MGWERTKSTIAPMPAKPAFMLWLMAGIVALIACLLLFILHVNKRVEYLQQYELWTLTASPLVTWFLLFCLRNWLYERGDDRHRFESEEAEYAQQQWVEWAGRYLAVLHGVALLPDAVTAAQCLSSPPGLIQHYRQARRIAWGEADGLEVLLAEARDALQPLPTDLPLNVTLLTDSLRDHASLQTLFTSVWQRLMPAERPPPVVHILPTLSLLALEQRLTLAELSAELFLVEQLQGGDRYSDALAVLLLATDDVSNRYRLKHHARLLRPMQLEGERQHDDLALFFSTQTQANSTRLIFGDSSDRSCSLAELLSASEATGGGWPVEQVHWLEKVAGLSGPFSPWIMAAVTSDVMSLQQADCLMLSGDRQHRFINTVTQGDRQVYNKETP